ncbi:MAG: carbon storage regulator CsrA [Ignavibacteria bacterium]|jgi:carbon storage regulator|nr:carbon storage regulator CsrA [Ignavibacteria bacterium]
MLVLSRKTGEVITVGKSITITVLSNDRGIVRLGIEAPKNVPVHRKEVFDKIVELNQQASKFRFIDLKNAISNKEVVVVRKKNEQNYNKQHNQNLITNNIVTKKK